MKTVEIPVTQIKCLRHKFQIQVKSRFIVPYSVDRVVNLTTIRFASDFIPDLRVHAVFYRMELH